jgi:hypothetical protein
MEAALSELAPGYTFIKAASFDEAFKALPRVTRAMLYHHSAWEPEHSEVAIQLGDTDGGELFRKLVEAVEARQIPWVVIDYKRSLYLPVMQSAAKHLGFEDLKSGNSRSLALRRFFDASFAFGDKLS